ncbi:hypothetical protein M427DRAFT_41853 [Gonapodya prolifera JEL478]|uniref:GPR1/FUN34/yaaH family protein n=1 Tax=Gonapodya prolifera (strain JEL478) TaxID=1344416 RepID=A0A139ARX9_GONPJ|nr:hypothetical protein M427DRAFT_41853 [Gonapodya prolifera JEL478]|eukprot:KXS19511.1 hypothetical protein M427DRAFT_41853 [Gonapodya prolifera JEL478]
MSNKANGAPGDEHENIVRKVDFSDSIGNPSAFGLFGFSMQLTLIGLLNAGYIEPDGAVVVYSFVLVAGILQLIVCGLAMLIKKELFGAVAFTVLGSFAVSMAMFNLLLITGTVQLHGPIDNAITAVFAIYAYIAFILMVAAVKMNIAAFLNFVGVVLLMVTGAASSHLNNQSLSMASSWFTILTGISGFYVATGAFLGETFRRPILPMGDFSMFRKVPAMKRRESGATEFMG